MPLPRNFQSFAEFEREIIRPSNRIGLSLEDIVEDTSFDAELELERDPFEGHERRLLTPSLGRTASRGGACA
jgi:hypothetical protein